jgi:tetratricopeptide (TPR) repeat protein
MQAACANLDGQYSKALAFSFETQNSVDTNWIAGGGYFGMYAEYMYMTPFFTWVRFGKWDDLLKARPIPDSRVYANSMWHWARGIAYSRKHQPDDAIRELQKLQANKSNPQLKESPSAFNPGIKAIEVAEKILEGVIADDKNLIDDAITKLKEAVDKEDAMLYNEPKDWTLPARHYLGQVLVKAKRYKEAEGVYRQDLMINPNNGWSLTGLQASLEKQNKNKEALTVKQQAKKALARTDGEITGSVF